MSQYIKDICRLIRNHPEQWSPLSGNSIYRGLTDGRIRIFNAGLGTYMFSIVDVAIDGKELSLRGWDRIRIEMAVNYWHRGASLKAMSNIQPQ